MNKKIKFAVIGLGHIGKRHVEMISKNKDAELAALIDTMPKQQLDVNYPGIPFFSSLNNFLESDIDTDIITIATPNGLHAKQAMQCLEKGLHVIVEKPLALNKQDAEMLINKSPSVNKYLFTVKQNRYSPVSVWLKKLIQEKIAGNIFMVQVNCFWNRDERYYQSGSWHGKKELDGGTLFTQFSHFIDMLYWIFGDIDNIKSKLRNFNHENLIEFEDSGIVTFDFVNGGIGSINYSTSVWDKNLESSITIIAENGSIKIGGQYMDKVESCHIKNYTLPQLKASNAFDNHKLFINNVIDILNNKVPVPNVSENAKVVEIVERVYNAQY